MTGKRKFLIALFYLAGLFAIAAIVARRGGDLAAVGIMATGLATGVGAFVWGNAQEHKHGGK